jgi:hypothetical protein
MDPSSHLWTTSPYKSGTLMEKSGYIKEATQSKSKTLLEKLTLMGYYVWFKEEEEEEEEEDVEEKKPIMLIWHTTLPAIMGSHATPTLVFNLACHLGQKDNLIGGHVIGQWTQLENIAPSASCFFIHHEKKPRNLKLDTLLYPKLRKADRPLMRCGIKASPLILI